MEWVSYIVETKEIFANEESSEELKMLCVPHCAINVSSVSGFGFEEVDSTRR